MVIERNVIEMKKMLITGGTVFVSRFAAAYFAKKYHVFVLNRNTKPQCDGVNLIKGDRHALGQTLKAHHFDVVLDITAYDKADVQDLLNALGSFDDYILISSSAVYPETEGQPFLESAETGVNRYWEKYGTDKIEAEKTLSSRVPHAYILRPPYLYGPWNNVYREAFVFDCAMLNRPFFVPGEGEMKLQFFHVKDLCRLVELIIDKKPERKIFNVGNRDSISVKQWVSMCYDAVGKMPEFISVDHSIPQRNYFPFYDYEYCLDVTHQYEIMSDVTSMEEGLYDAFQWYKGNKNSVNRKPLIDFIDNEISKRHG